MMVQERRLRQRRNWDSYHNIVGRKPPIFLTFCFGVLMMASNKIQIIGKHRGTTKILDEASNKDEAKQQVNYWKRLKPGWRITSKPK